MINNTEQNRKVLEELIQDHLDLHAGVHVQGRPWNISQYGVPYCEWFNGKEFSPEETLIGPDFDFLRVCDEIRYWFNGHKHAVIVWRVLPGVYSPENPEEQIRVYWRCHTMLVAPKVDGGF